MRRITPEERGQLRGFERFAFGLAELGNRPFAKPVGQRFLGSVGRAWVKIGSGNLQRIQGLEALRDLRPENGVLLVSNHRSFFDMYVLSSILLHETALIERMYFPVRSNFFYERPLGVVLNFWLAMMSMYPPIFRERDRKLFNRFSVDFLIDALQQKGTLVGFHPEGKRNKGEDPFTLLPAQPGVGQIAYHAKPTVIPVFISGLSNDIVAQVRGNFARTGAPIHVVFGAPLSLDAHYAKPAGGATYQAIADTLRDEITQLGARLRESDEHPQRLRA